MSFIQSLFGDAGTKAVKDARRVVAQINNFEEEIKAFKDEDFSVKTGELKARIATGETLDAILPYAFALVREAARRTLGQRHYDVQLIGGIVLHNGNIAEMRTGEGKTLVSTLPAYLNALTGNGVHIVTVNDYLARRDAVWMGQVHSFLGLSVGILNGQQTSYRYDPLHKEVDTTRDQVGSYRIVYEFLKPCTRKEAYATDITYGTNSEFGFDYLRDNLAQTLDRVVQPGHAYAIVDEIDSILIDEARTPLIISSDFGDSEDLYTKFAGIARNLFKDEDYTVDEKHRSISLTDTGITKAEGLLGIQNIYTEKGIKYVHHLETAIRAQALYVKDKEYVVSNNEIVIVDPFTGRMQPGRRWSEGLHQAIEAKEGVKIENETRAAATITYQNFFRFYKKLGGMTGTAETSKEEFYKVYGLDVVAIPTHRTVARIDRADLIFQNEQAKYKAIANKVKELQDKGQPVLIGTISIEKNELLSAYLSSAGVRHTVLNAKNHEKEGEIVANAGKKGSVTVATNMAGRGVDIKLGGANATDEEYEEVKALGGLFVVGTERHEARRIDNQLRGRAGRQGDPGETQFYVSLDDDLMRIFGSDSMKSMMKRIGMPEDMPIEHRMISKALENAQTRIEGFHFDARKSTLEYDDVMNQQRKAIYGRRNAMLRADRVEIESYLSELLAWKPEAEPTVAERRASVGDEPFFETVRRIILHVTDMLWVEHIETMEYYRSSVNLRAYGQREPLVEYKREGLRLYKEMEERTKEEILNLITTISSDATRPVQDAGQPISLMASHEDLPVFNQEPVGEMHPNARTHIEAVKQEMQKKAENEVPKVGRNEPCPCGSGKKYKKCHGA
jgi:preprotein translocase subunit SecA